MLIKAIRKFLGELSESFTISLGRHNIQPGDLYGKRNQLILKLMGNILSLLLLFFGTYTLINGNLKHGITNLSVALVLFFSVEILRKTEKYQIALRIIIYLCVIYTIYLFQIDTREEGLFLWTLTAPMFFLFFLRLKEGVITAIFYLVVNNALTIFGVFNTSYSSGFLLRYTGVYLTMVIMSYIYGRIQLETTGNILQGNRELRDAVTSLQKTRDNLLKSEEQYRALVENSNDGIGILQDSKFIYANSKLCAMTGFSRDELLNKPLGNVIVSENEELMQRLFNRETWSGLPRDRVELSLLTQSGEQVEVEVGTNTVDYKGTESQLIFIKDVRDRNLIEKEKSKLANLESFRIVANGMTHDFNNILTIILGNLELIKLTANDNPRIHKATSKIEEASRRASELLDDLFVFSTSSVKEESLEKIREIIDPLFQVLKTDFGAGNFTLRYEEKIQDLRCDRKQIGIALKNILLNSVDATGGESEIEVTVSGFSNHAGLIRPLEKGDYVKIAIKDSGKGIPQENIGKIFDPYFSTKMNVTEKGIGLGLAIANKIVLDHMGLITVESKEGKGTTFTIFLPAET